MIHTYTEPNERIIDLLTETVLGTNGSRYQHLDTAHRIYEADHPLFLTLERNNRVWGNLTFCRRGEDWYIRYFAFRSFLQAGGNTKSNDRSQSFIKQALQRFFDDAFTGNSGHGKVNSMYAYIDPRNERSKWMSEHFGFQVIGSLATQSFSRLTPKKSKRFMEVTDADLIAEISGKKRESHRYFNAAHISKPPFYGLISESGELLALVKSTRVNWKIERLPGRFGGVLKSSLPFVPFIRRLINPNKFTFLVPDVLYVKDNSYEILNELFEALLEKESANVLLWWIDRIDSLYLSVQSKMNWGILHSVLGVQPVDVVQRTSKMENAKAVKPQFVAAFDMV
jgi:hypothetical protein